MDPLNISKAGDFSRIRILKDFIQVQKEEGKFVVVCSRPPKNGKLGGFTSLMTTTTTMKTTMVMVNDNDDDNGDGDKTMLKQND